MSVSLPVVRSASELPGQEGKRVHVRGLYSVQNLGAYSIMVKGPDGQWKPVHRVAFLKLKNECLVELENRPDCEMDELDGRRASATGKLVIPAESPADSPDQYIMARPEPLPTLVEITSVEPLRRRFWPFGR